VREGEERARAWYAGELERERDALARALEGFARRRETYFRDVEREAVQLTLRIAGKVLEREARADPLAVAAMVHVALASLQRGTAVTLRANQTTTVVNHQSCNPNSHISVMPLTLNALNALIAPAAPPKILQTTRVMTSASGNVAYTGLGFKPTFIEFQCGISGGNPCASQGAADAVTGINTCLESVNFTGGPQETFYQNGIAGIVRTDAALANYQFFTVASFDADGFTLAWTKNGTPVATMSISAFCTPATGPVGGGNVGGVRVSARTTGSFTLTHASNAAVDQTFTYSITGGA